MANIRKSFNFRSGVQVDDDNLIVNPLGLVGIGTTVPTESLDVRGTLKVVGLVTAYTGFVTDLTVNTLTVQGSQVLSGGLVGSGVSLSSGIVTSSTASGIVTYYGDGSQLLDLPTSQWVDIDVGLGFTSIYSVGNVGVATNDPRYSLQIGGNNGTTLTNGVGINSTGDINATGIVTSGSFVGPLTGDVTGDIVSAASTLGMSNATSLDVTGIVTAANGFIGGLSGDVQGNLNGNVNSSGISTFSDIQVTAGTITIAAGVVTATKFVGHFDGSILNNATGTSSTITNLNTSVIDASGGQIITGVVTATHSNLGITTVSSLRTQSIGVGVPVSEKAIEIFKTGISTVEVTGTSVSELILGNQTSSTTGFGQSTAYIRYGSSAGTLDIINADYGGIDMYLNSANVSGIDTGAFRWIDGRTNDVVAMLSHDGKLGIGKSNASADLDIVGLASITQGLTVGGDLVVGGNIQGTLDITRLNSVDINNSSSGRGGISTFRDLYVSGSINGISTIGIGTIGAMPGYGLDSRNNKAMFQAVGIGTTVGALNLLDIVGGIRADRTGIGSDAGADGLLVKGEPVSFINSQVTLTSTQLNLDGASGIGIGTHTVAGILDFRNAGTNQANARFLLPPTINNTIRTGLTTVAGALVYNETSNQLQVYNGSAWQDTSSAGVTQLNGLNDVTISSAKAGDELAYNGSSFVNDYTNTLTTTATGQVSLLDLAIANYRSVEYLIQVVQGSNIHTTKILAMHNGTTAYHTEYGTLKTGSDLATFDVDINGGNLRLRVTPASASSTVFKVKFTAISV